MAEPIDPAAAAPPQAENFGLEGEANDEFVGTVRLLAEIDDFLAAKPGLSMEKQRLFRGLAMSLGLDEAQDRVPDGFFDPPDNPVNGGADPGQGGAQADPDTPFRPRAHSTVYLQDPQQAQVDLIPILSVIDTLQKEIREQKDRAHKLENKVVSLTAISNGYPNSSILPTYESNHMLVPPPILGTVELVSANILKSLMACVGSEKYSVENLKSKPLRHYLPMVATAIQQNRLSDKAAYTVLMHILTGDVYITVSNFQQAGQSFNHTWKHIQLVAQSSYSREQVEKEIKKLTSARPISLNTTLTKMHALYFDLFKHVNDPKKKREFISQGLCQDVFKLVDKHYPECFGPIESEYERLRKLNESNLDEDFDEAATLIEIVVSYISKRQINLDRSTAAMHAMDVNMADKGASFESSPIAQGEQLAVSIANAMVQAFNGLQPQNQAGSFPGGYQGKGNSAQKSQPPTGQAASQGNRQQPQRVERNVKKGCCWLCAGPKHMANECRKYPGQRATKIQCKYCTGYHPFPCKDFHKHRARPGSNSQSENSQAGTIPRNQGLANSGRQEIPVTAQMNSAEVGQTQNN